MTERIEIAERVPYGFPFVATLRGEAVNYRRIDTPVVVMSRLNSERHYYRVKLPTGRIRIVNDSMLYIEE